MKTAFIFLSFVIMTAANAQVNHTETLNGNNVSVMIGDESFFFRDAQNIAAYEYPAGSGLSTIFHASFWAGAMDVNNQLYVSGYQEGEGSWRSGPIADPMYYGSNAYSNTYGKSIWKVTRQQVIDHQNQYQQQGYVLDPDWPGNGDASLGVADQLAPYFDANGNGVYEPLQGDYPDFPGDEVVYVINNDASYLPGINPMKVELHLMFYQFNNSGFLGETTFLNVRVFNRSTTDYYNYRQSLYLDFDIGNYKDDFMGCDSLRNMIYAYNGDVLDETNGGTSGYGNNPPCQALISLNRPMTVGSYYVNDTVVVNPQPNADLQAWNYMNAIWPDGTPMTYGGSGNSNGMGTPTTHIFTGNPFLGTGWTPYTANNGGPFLPSDTRGLHVVAPGDFPAGTMFCTDYALIVDNTGGHLENVQNVMYIADALQNLYDSNNGNFPCGAFTAGLKEHPESLDFALYPNPTSGIFTLDLNTAGDETVIRVFDVTGRNVLNTSTSDTQVQLKLNENPGVYSIIIETRKGVAQKLLVLE